MIIVSYLYIFFCTFTEHKIELNFPHNSEYAFYEKVKLSNVIHYHCNKILEYFYVLFCDLYGNLPYIISICGLK